jgi:hypothetical protein
MAFKMYGKSPVVKALVGKQNNLPEELKAKIIAAPEKGDPVAQGADRADVRSENKQARKEKRAARKAKRSGDTPMAKYKHK